MQSDELFLWLSAIFGSPIAVGTYILVSLIVIPTAIWLYFSQDWTRHLIGMSIIGVYAVIMMVIFGVLAQHYFGNWVNVVFAIAVLYGAILALVITK